MQYSATMFALLRIFPLTVAGNQITFISQDSNDRTLEFTPNPGYGLIIPQPAPAGKTVSVTFPAGWQGNFKAPLISDITNINWVLGEVTFQGGTDNDQTNYDVSSICSENDNTGVHWLYPSSGTGTKSGCDAFPCDTAYRYPDDTQTRVTSETELTCLLGVGNQG